MHSTMGLQADNCRVMVRVYANMLGLSKAFARAGMVGNEARSVSPFISGFNRAEGLFDLVDAGDKKEGSDFKIRGRHSCHKSKEALLTGTMQRCFGYLWISINVSTSTLPDVMTRALAPY